VLAFEEFLIKPGPSAHRSSCIRCIYLNWLCSASGSCRVSHGSYQMSEEDRHETDLDEMLITEEHSIDFLLSQGGGSVRSSVQCPGSGHGSNLCTRIQQQNRRIPKREISWEKRRAIPLRFSGILRSMTRWQTGNARISNHSGAIQYQVWAIR